MVGEGFVKRRGADLDDFEPGRAFEHAVADHRRLKHQVALVHHERLALVLVDDAHPAAADEDHLQRDAVVMDPVGDRPALREW